MSFVGVDTLPIYLSTSRININLCKGKPSRLFPEVATDEEEEDDWESEVGLEEIFGGTDAIDAEWGDGSVELGSVSMER